MMKTFAIVLLCVVAAVQGRSTAVQASSQRSVAALGENPWVVHLRLAVSTSGLLKTCAGSLIDASWLLTSATCVHDIRFMWARFGAVEVIRPELVLETNSVRVHQDFNLNTLDNNIALVTVNRVIELSQNIAVIPLPPAGAEIADTASLCLYGQNEDNTPGDDLRCGDVEIIEVNDTTLVTGGYDSIYDTGAAVVSDGVQIGVVSQRGRDSGTIVVTRVEAYVDWISSQSGVQSGRAGAPSPVDIVN